jgi:transcriptional regulator with XRE-family HTH domain
VPVDNILKLMKKLLKSRGLTYQDVAKALALSEPSVKRLFTSEKLSLGRLAVVCDLLGVSIGELSRLAEREYEESPQTMTSQQEEHLIADSKLFTFFYLLISGWQPKEIRQHYVISVQESTKFLLALDKLGIIELHPKERVKFLVSRDLDWLRDGPIRRQYELSAREDFLSHGFDNKHDRLKYKAWEISESTMNFMCRKIDKFLKEMDSAASVDDDLSKEQTKSYAFLIGIRPWVFSLLARHKR